MLLVRTLKVAFIVVVMAGTVAFAMAHSEPVQTESPSHHALVVNLHQDEMDAEAQLENALSAAPPAIAKDATVMGTSPEGEEIVLREGTNGWTCYPDWTGSPDNDPACYDATWMVWNEAFAAGTDPDITTPGLAYMLQGGSDPSNTDPFAMEPLEGEEWIRTPPHIMILLPEPLDQTLFSTDHSYGGPYIMWAGTPYEHIMMPVNLEEMEH